MKSLKRVVCLGGALILLLSFGLPAAQAVALDSLDLSMPMGGMLPPGGGDCGDCDIKYLTGLRIYDYDAGTLFAADVGDDLSELELPETLACYIEGQGTRVYWCPVEWRFDETDNATAGRVSIPGTLQPEEGYVLKEDFSQEVSYTAVILCEEDMARETLQDIEYSLTKNGYSVRLGENPAEEAFISKIAWCKTVLNEIYPAEVRWDFSGVDSAVVGAYPITGRLILPYCFETPAGAETEFASYVFVVDPVRVDLTAVTKDTDAAVYCEWYYIVPTPASMIVEYAVVDPAGGWVPNTEYPYQSYPGGTFLYGTYNAYSLTVQKGKLSPGVDYYFRIRYEDTVSNVLHVNIGGESPQEPPLLEGVNDLSYELKLFPTGVDPSDIELPDTVRCTHTYGRFSVECAVEWDVAALDTSTPGWRYIKGEIKPPEGYRIEDSLAAYYPVMLVEEGMKPEPLKLIDGTDLFFLIGRGDEVSDWFALRDYFGHTLPDTAFYMTQNGLGGAAPVIWDFSTLDTSETGMYAVSGVVELPACFSPPQGAASVTTDVGVVEPDRIDLSAFRMGNQMNRSGICYWLHTVDDIENITLEYATNDGPWQKVETEPELFGVIWAADVPCRYESNQLAIQFSNLSDGDHYFRLVYRGEPSNVLHIRMDENLLKDWDIGGDRGGADQGNQNPPDIEQPAPSPNPDNGSASDSGNGQPGNQNPSGTQNPDLDNRDDSPPDEQPGSQGSQNPPGTQPPTPDTDGGDNNSIADRDPAGGTDSGAPLPPASVELLRQTGSDQNAGEPEEPNGPGAHGVMMEYSTLNSLSISGLHLNEILAATGNTVLFEKHGVAVELPVDFLAGLEVSDTSRFEVRIKKGENSFVLEIFLDDVPLSGLPPTAVYVPFALVDGINTDDLACFDEQGREVSTAIYDAIRQIVRVEILATGSYTIAARGAGSLPVSAPTIGGNEAAVFTGDAMGSLSGWLIFPVTGVVAAALCARFIMVRRKRGIGVGGDG